MDTNEKFMLKTLGYAYSEHKDHYHITPILFYNEPELEHLDWITTLFPKDTVNNTEYLNQQIYNFVQYYRQKQLLIIGGDASCFIGILKDYPNTANLISHHKTQLPPLPKNIILNGTNGEDTILCIDAKYSIPKESSKAKIIVIVNYDYMLDSDKRIFKAIKNFIKSTTV